MSSAPDFSLHKTRLAARLDQLFKNKIDLGDVVGASSDSQQQTFNTRALAAYAITCLVENDPDSAAECVTDGPEDNGIDAICIDDTGDTVVYFVQSKWPSRTSKGVDQADAMKFMRGIGNILQTQWDNLNPKIQALVPRLQQAVLDPKTLFVAVICSPSTNLLAQHARKEVDSALESFNEGLDPIVTVEEFDLTRLYRSLTVGSGASSIDMEVTLYDWGLVKDPYLAYYGQVEIGELLTWRQHGGALFDRNLRPFQGLRTDVFQSISATIANEPQHFWYFNNGATMLCSSLEKQPIYSGSRDKGIFTCRGVSIVNGAQSIGSIWNVTASGAELDPQTRMPIRIISLQSCPEGFANAVTRASNTQNRIGSRDFAALDQNQHRLAVEMLLTGKRYTYRPGDRVPERDDGTDITEATPAIACATSLALAVQAKREVGRLWANIETEPYTLIFNDALSAEHMWRVVQIAKSVDSSRDSEGKKNPHLFRGRLVARHGNRFILYRVFADPEMIGYESATDLTGFIAKAGVIAARELGKVANYLEQRIPNAYPQTTFKNAAKCQEMDTGIPRGPAAPSPAQPKPGEQLDLFDGGVLPD